MYNSKANDLIEYYPINSLNELNIDYVKSLCYNNFNKTLFTGGLDGNICYYDIDSLKPNTIYSTKNNLLYHTDNNNSIYSIDTSFNGNIISTSVYNNIIDIYDIRVKSSLFKLSKHNDLIKTIKISPSGDILLSGGCDKVVYLWDLRYNNKVLKTWDYYCGSIIDIKPINGFSEFLSSDIKGNLFYTNILNNVYTKLTSLDNEILTSISVDESNLNILCSSNFCNIYEYVRQFILLILK